MEAWRGLEGGCVWFPGLLITVVFLWKDGWVCLWEQNPDFNYIPSGYSHSILRRILFLWLSSTLLKGTEGLKR